MLFFFGSPCVQLKQQDRVEVFAFAITNTLTLLYAGLQGKRGHSVVR